MTPQESRLLQDFLTQLGQAGSVPKDREADDLVQRAARAQPDALYLVVQRSLIQQQALDAAQRRIDDLERSARAGSGATTNSFLGDSAWGRGGGTNRATPDRGLASEAAAVFGSRPQAPVAAAAGTGPVDSLAARQGGAGSRAGSFLGQAATMAAGVAGGAFLFHGIESLLGHNGGAGGGFLNPGGLEPVTENVTINEYGNNDSSDPAARDWNDDPGRQDDGGSGADYSDAGGDDSGGGFDGDFGGDDGMA